MRVVVSAAEPSAEMLAAELSREIGVFDSDCEVLRLQSWVSTAPVLGFGHGAASAANLSRAIGRAVQVVDRLQPRVIVLISYSSWHLPFGLALRRRGYRVLVLAPPQFWVWAGWRVRLLARAADVVVCLFGFEEQLLRRSGVNACYFGYPLFDSIVRQAQCTLTPDSRRRLVLLPGSRPNELKSHHQLFVPAARMLGERFPDCSWTVLSPTDTARYAKMAQATAAIAASGTVTLELAIIGVPMVVCYRLPWAELILARLLVHTKYFALPNIIARTRIVSELLNPGVGELAAAAVPFLQGEERRQEVRAALRGLVDVIGPPGAMSKIARLVLDLGSSHSGRVARSA